MNKALLIFALLINATLLFSQNNYGLRFKSKDVIKKNRTGLDLTKNGSISYSSSFEIKFDLSFREYQGFGYIFRLKELNSGNQIDLICKLDEASPGLYLVSNKKETEARIGLNNILTQPKNEWNELLAKFNADSGTVQLCFKDEIVTEQINFPNNSEFVIAFGVINNYEFDTKEVPYISLRNITIRTDDGENHAWPLNNYSGNISKDTINNKIAEITNPEWEIYHHSTWKHLAKTSLSERTQVVYDKNKEKIFLVGRKNKIYFFDLNSNSFDSILYSGSPPVCENDNQVIITNKSELISYSLQEKQISAFDFERKRWSAKYKRNDSLQPKYWHHNKLISPIDNSIVTICGYGFYKYNNYILSFNKDQKYWDTIRFNGDTIYPRYLSSLGQNPKNKNQYYLFGGFGNKSGDQVLGTEFYYDLYEIDFSDSSIVRKWIFNNKKDNFTPINSLLVDENNENFYTLGFTHHDENTYLKVLKANIEKPEYSFIADSIPYYFLDTWSFADLYYWASARKLVAITLSCEDEKNFEINVYSLKYPPGSIHNLDTKNGFIQNWSSTKMLIIVASIFLLIVVVFVYSKFLRARKTTGISKSQTNNGDSKLNYNKIKAAENRPVSINLFGGFQVFDKKGKDITYRFSPTLKQLFLLLLLHSFKNSKGISSLKIQEVLWPDKSPSSAKNNRGVNIKKLRSILPDIGDIQVVYESPYWKIEVGKDIFCDYYHVNNFLQDQTEELKDIEPYYQFLSYLKRGNLLTNIETDWLDKFKSEMSTKIVQFLERKLKKADFKNDVSYILETVAIISQFDLLNETALNCKCKALNCLGEHGLALNTYKNYTKLYLNVYGEEYKLPLKEIIKA